MRTQLVRHHINAVSVRSLSHTIIDLQIILEPACCLGHIGALLELVSQKRGMAQLPACVIDVCFIAWQN